MTTTNPILTSLWILAEIVTCPITKIWNLNRTVFPRICFKEALRFQQFSENPSEVLDNPKPKPERPGESDHTADTENRSKKIKLNNARSKKKNVERRKQMPDIGPNIFLEVDQRANSRLFFFYRSGKQRSISYICRNSLYKFSTFSWTLRAII